MAAEWYYADEGQQQGPISFEQLKERAAAGLLRPADLVWRQGLEDWLPASTQPGLFTSSPAPPQPRPYSEWTEDQEQPAREDRRDYPRQKASSGLSTGVGIALGGCGVVALLLAVCGGVVAVILWQQSGAGNERSWSLAKGKHIHWLIPFNKGDNVVITVTSKTNSDMDLFIFDDKSKMDAFLKWGNLEKALHFCLAYDNTMSRDCQVSFKAPAKQDYWVLLVNRISQDEPARNGPNSGTLVFQPAPK
jgi:GYF domain 2